MWEIYGHLSVFEEDGRGSTVELVASVEARDLENEEVANNLALELVNEVGSGLGGATYKSKHVSQSLGYVIYDAIGAC